MNSHRSNLWKFYLAAFLSGFAVFYNGVDTLFYRHFQLSFEQIGFLVSASLTATLIFEIPTGSFADLYGKKTSIVIGSCFALIGLGFLAFGSTFAAFAVGFILLGIGRAFRSGAESALLYDWLSSLGQQQDYTRHQSRLQGVFVAIDIISGSVGFLLFQMNVRIPFLISFASMALVILVQLTFQEPSSPEASHAPRTDVLASYVHQIKAGWSVVWKSRMIRWLITFTLIYSIANLFFSTALNLPFLREVKGFTTSQLAIMGLIWNIIQTASLFYVSSIEARLGQFASIIAIVLLTPALFLGLFLSQSFLFSSLLIGLYYSSMSFREVIVDAYLNTRISSQYRATVLSIASMIVSGMAIVLLPALGNMADRFGLKTGFLVLIVSVLVLGLWSAVARRRAVLRDDPGESPV